MTQQRYRYNGPDDYGNFDILWKGALEAILRDYNNKTKQPDDIVVDRRTQHEKPVRAEPSILSRQPALDQSLTEFLDSLDDDFLSQEENNKKLSQTQACTSNNRMTGCGSISDESPLKPVKKKKHRVIESDSEADTSTDQNNSKNHDNMFDSDSDLEILNEDWRPPSSTSRTDLDTMRLLNETLDDDDFLTQSTSPVKLILSSKPPSQEFKMPVLPLVPKPKLPTTRRRRGLRLRTDAHLNAQITNINPGYNKSNHKVKDKNKVGDTRSRGGVKRRGHVPVSLEEELVGEALNHSDDDVDECYEQRADGALIEGEAQCSSSDDESEESDGEYDQSFVNDHTIMSQQLSQGIQPNQFLKVKWENSIQSL